MSRDDNPYSTPETQATVTAELPLSAIQQRHWFIEKLDPGTRALNISVRWKILGTAPAEALEAAFQTIIERHEILRSRFIEKNGLPVQQVLDHIAFKLDHVDLRAVPESAQQARVDQISDEISALPFDLGEAGQIRATLIRRSAEAASLVFVAHHICFDGYSIRILGREFGAAVAAHVQGRSPDLPDLPLQYGDYALWQNDYLASDEVSGDLGYWTDTLAELPYFELQTDFPRPPVHQHAVEMVLVPLRPDFETKLKAAAHELGVSAFTIGTALLSAVLHRITAKSDVVFETQVSGRTDEEVQNLIGVFINSVILRSTVQSDRTLAEHVRSMRDVTEGALVHQMLPFDRLVQELNPRRDRSRNLLTSINFALQEAFLETRSYGDIKLQPEQSYPTGSFFDLDFAVLGRPDGWRIDVSYLPALFRRETAEAFGRALQTAFDSLFSSPEMRISELPLPELLETSAPETSEPVSDIEDRLAVNALVGAVAVIRVGAEQHAYVTPGRTGLMPLDTLAGSIKAESDPEGRLTSITAVAELPRDAGGNIDRAALLVAHAAIKPPPPEADTETTRSAEIREIWKHYLGRVDLPPGANFFDLGGHSLLALRVINEFRNRWGEAISVAEFYENATVEGLSRKFAARNVDTSDDDWRIMRLHPATGPLPVISINHFDLALALSREPGGPDGAICLRLYDNLQGDALTAETFEEAARQYADIARKAHPGPYLLFGNCVHGNLALEAARILQEDGQEIAAVVMSDVWEPGYAERLDADRYMRWKERFAALGTRLRAVKRGELTVRGLLASYSIFRKSRVLRLFLHSADLPDGVQATDLDPGLERFIRRLSAMRNVYRPRPVDLPVLHIVTDITPQGRGFQNSVGWEDIVAPGQLRTVEIKRLSAEAEGRNGVVDLNAAITGFLAARGYGSR